MKTNNFKSILPIAAVFVAIGGAFAFNHAPEKSTLIDVNGSIPGATCTETSVICQTENNGVFCTNESSQELWKINPAGTACPTRLYQKL
jgi:hypothetical protein